MKAVIYHNPRCSKSRATLQLLTENGVDPVVINYLESPLKKAELQKLCRLLNKKPVELIRFKERVAKENQLAPADDRTEAQWLELLAAHPILLERPIVVVDERKAALGRPPENVLQII